MSEHEDRFVRATQSYGRVFVSMIMLQETRVAASAPPRYPNPPTAGGNTRVPFSECLDMVERRKFTHFERFSIVIRYRLFI
jgi:hypothetical protein